MIMRLCYLQGMYLRPGPVVVMDCQSASPFHRPSPVIQGRLRAFADSHQHNLEQQQAAVP